MFERKQTIAEYARHLPDRSVFTFRQAFTAMEQFCLSKCEGCEDDGLVFLTGIFDDDPKNFQVVLARVYDMFSQLTVAIQYPKGIRSRLTPETQIVSTDRSESSQFFTDVAKTRGFWLFKNMKPLSCSVEYIDADDRGDEFYSGVAKLAATM